MMREWWLLAMQQLLLLLAAMCCWRAGAVAADNASVFMLAGQSNMVGENIDAGDGPSRWQSPSILQLGRFPPHALQLIPAEDPLQHNSSGQVGPGLSFAWSFVAGGGGPVALVPCAVLGTLFEKYGTDVYTSSICPFWNPVNMSQGPAASDHGCSLYYDCVSRANYLLQQPGYSMGGVLWLQGESNREMTQAQYTQSLGGLIVQMRQDLLNASTAPFLVGQMNPNWAMSPGEDFPDVQDAIDSVPFELPYTATVYGLDPRGQSLPSGYAGLVHYAGSSQRWLGFHYYAAYNAALANFPGAVVPGVIVQLFAAQLNASFALLSWVPDPIAVSYNVFVDGALYASTSWLNVTYSDTASYFMQHVVWVAGVGPTRVAGPSSVTNSFMLGPAAAQAPAAYSSGYPASVQQPSFWVTADSLNTTLADGANVSFWLDQSGAGNYLATPVMSPQSPTFRLNVYGQHSAVRFNFSRMLAFGGFPVQSNWTLCAVLYPAFSQVNESAYILSASNQSLYMSAGNLLYYIQYGTLYPRSQHALPAATLLLLSLVCNDLASSCSVYIQGALDSTIVAPAEVGGTIASPAFALGSDVVSVYPFVGDVLRVHALSVGPETVRIVLRWKTSLNGKYGVIWTPSTSALAPGCSST